MGGRPLSTGPMPVSVHGYPVGIIANGINTVPDRGYKVTPRPISLRSYAGKIRFKLWRLYKGTYSI